MAIQYACAALCTSSPRCQSQLQLTEEFVMVVGWGADWWRGRAMTRFLLLLERIKTNSESRIPIDARCVGNCRFHRKSTRITVHISADQL